MFIPGLPAAVWRAVNQSFSWCRVARDTWKCGQCVRAFGRKLEQPDGEDGAKKPRPKTVPVPKITLVSLDNSITVTVLEVAQRLAKRRNLTLIKVDDLDDKSQRAVYKLVNSSGVLKETEEEDAKSTNKTAQKSEKGTKLLYIYAKIAEYDLETKTKNVTRLLNKGHKVKIIITLDGVNGDKVQRIIENAVKTCGSIQRMSSKKSVILLLINPLIKNEEVSVDNKDETVDSS